MIDWLMDRMTNSSIGWWLIKLSSHHLIDYVVEFFLSARLNSSTWGLSVFAKLTFFFIQRQIYKRIEVKIWYSLLFFVMLNLLLWSPFWKSLLLTETWHYVDFLVEDPWPLCQDRICYVTRPENGCDVDYSSFGVLTKLFVQWIMY